MNPEASAKTTGQIHVADSSSIPQSLDTATLKLLVSWWKEDATNDPELIRAAECELAEFKNQMNESRRQAGEPILYP